MTETNRLLAMLPDAEQVLEWRAGFLDAKGCDDFEGMRGAGVSMCDEFEEIREAAASDECEELGRINRAIFAHLDHFARERGTVLHASGLLSGDAAGFHEESTFGELVERRVQILDAMKRSKDRLKKLEGEVRQEIGG